MSIYMFLRNRYILDELKYSVLDVRFHTSINIFIAQSLKENVVPFGGWKIT